MKTNKKGFTLVEVLGAIAILAVISMVVIPSIAKYVTEGKDRYNEKLEKQLLVAGQNYFSDNNNLLPKKTYLDKNTEKHSFVTVPEMQSSNYLDQEFIDSNGYKCQQSFVFVTIPIGETEKQWHACLKCESETGEKGYETDDAYCNISNWDDDMAPICGTTKDAKDGVTIAGFTANVNNKYYNPKTVKLNHYSDEKGEISQIWISNITTNYIKVLNVYKKENINEINLVNYFEKNSNKELIDGEYQIYLRDTGGNFSEVCNKRIIIDNTDPTCTLTYKPADSKLFKFTKKDNSVNKGWTNNIKGVIDQENKTTGVDYTKVSITQPKQDGTYYGHVEDEAGNSGICQTDVKIQMLEGDAPYCIFTKNVSSTKYLKAGATTKLQIECYAYQADQAVYNKTKIITSNLDKIGSVSSTENAKDNKNKENKKIFDLTYKATTEKKSGIDNVIIEEAYVTDKTGKTNNQIKSNEIKVDAIPPVVTQKTNKNKESDGWYKAPLTVTATCTDTGGSGISKLTFAGKTGTTSLSITRSSPARPVKYTSTCTDKAGNSATQSVNYYVREYNADSSCGCKTYKSCRTKSCGCKTRNRCKSCGCQTWHYTTGYNYYYKYSHQYCSNSIYNIGSDSCYSGRLGGLKCRCSKSGSCPSSRKYLCTCYVCSSSSYRYADYCKTYKRCSSCSCATYKTCRASACGCQTYKTCWHY